MDSRTLKPGNWGAKFSEKYFQINFPSCFFFSFLKSFHSPVQTWKTLNSCGFLFCWICVGEKCPTLNSEWSSVCRVVVFSCAISNALIGIFKDFPHIRLLTWGPEEWTLKIKKKKNQTTSIYLWNDLVIAQQSNSLKISAQIESLKSFSFGILISSSEKWGY